jgi:uncharacterized protein (TIGR03067 family)
MKRTGLAIVVVGLLAAAGTAGQDASKADKEKLVGSWEVLSGEKGGEKVRENEIKNIKLVFHADGKLTLDKDGQQKDATYKLDAKKKPKEFDLTINENGKEVMVKGIYHLEGDNLKLCFAGPEGERPTAFATQAGDKTMLVVLKRDKQ